MMKFLSPAKINHFLHILGRRKDGYHELQTLFQYLDYGDELTFELQNSADILIKTEETFNLAQEQNLIYRIAHYLQKRFGITTGVHVTLTKRIPMGGGLGGGSSNAATTLLVLNHLWDLKLDRDTLLSIGAQFGADIPCFVLGHSAWGEGIGTKLTPANPPEKWVLVITPPCHVATPQIYQHPDLTRNTSPFRIKALEERLKNGQLDQVVSNDFENLVCRLYPEVAECLNFLNRLGDPQHNKPKLSGSGSSVFCLFDTEQNAKSVLQCLPRNIRAFVAKGINQSPLHAQLKTCLFQSVLI